MTNLAEAIDVLVTALKDPEGSYWQAWKANIAVAFQDEAYCCGSRDSRELTHEISNRAADRFLQILTRDITKDTHYEN